MGRHQIARAVEARLAQARIELSQAVADGDVRADHKDGIGEAGVTTVVDLVQDAPGGKHRHDSGFAGARRHLAGIALKGGDPFLLPLLARLVPRDLDSLPEIGAGFDEQEDGLDRFELSEEERDPLLPLPPGEQVGGGAGDTGVAVFAPGLDPFANTVDPSQLDRGPRSFASFRLTPAGRRAIVIDGGAPPGLPNRRLAFTDLPMLRRLFVRRAEDGLGNFVEVHPPNAFTIASSFSSTSGWMCSGLIAAAISR